MERVGEDVARELARFGASADFAALVEAWPARVGSQIARNAWPARVSRDGTLHVHTSSSAWAFELGQLEPQIRSSLGELAPPRLRFAVGPLPEPKSEPDERGSRRIEASPRHLAAGAELAAEIQEKNLRKVVAKAAALSLASAESGRSSW